MDEVNESFRIVDRGFEDRGASAIPKDHARGPIRVVDDRRHNIRADRQYSLLGSAGNQLRSDLYRVKKCRARCRKVESPRPLRPELVLHNTGRRREKHVGRYRPHDDYFDLSGIEPTLRQSFFRRRNRKVAGGNPFLDDVPFSNPNSRQDPFVVGIDHPFQVGIGEKARRHIGAQSTNLGADRFGQSEPLRR